MLKMSSHSSVRLGCTETTVMIIGFTLALLYLKRGKQDLEFSHSGQASPPSLPLTVTHKGRQSLLSENQMILPSLFFSLIPLNVQTTESYLPYLNCHRYKLHFRLSVFGWNSERFTADLLIASLSVFL